MLTPRQKALVQESFARIAPLSMAVADLFYERLFTLDPSLRPLFTSDMAEQRRKLMQTLTVAVQSLDRLEQIIPAVAALGRRHVSYGVSPEHYNTVADALWTLERGLGPAFTPEVRQAWTDTYLLLATTMQSAQDDVAA